MINIGLYLAYGLVIIATIGAFLVPLGLAFMNGNLKGLLKGAIGVGIILVVFLISYAISEDELIRELPNIDASTSKKVGGALIMTYIFMVVAFVAMIFTELSKLFR